MDRLTVRGKQNKNLVYIAAPVNGLCKIQPNFCPVAEECDKNTKMISDRKCPTLQLVDRLAEYEDTGLSPAEVAELAQAKADGRVVVLPCKVGDTVYVVVTDCDCAYTDNMNDCAYCDYVVMPCDDFFRYDEDEWECGFKPHVREDKFSIAMYEQLGKTIFLTREEAERALKERDNND